jgi:hypothetical protein
VPASTATSAGIHKVVMWRFPIVRKGLSYVADVPRTGPNAEEIRGLGFLEPNSKVGSAMRPLPRARRSLHEASLCAEVPTTCAIDDARASRVPGADACSAWTERERRGAPAGDPVAQSRSPALADIIGARRACTAAMISSGSIPCG